MQIRLQAERLGRREMEVVLFFWILKETYNLMKRGHDDDESVPPTTVGQQRAKVRVAAKVQTTVPESLLSYED
jgi:hypothetical protein